MEDIVLINGDGQSVTYKGVGKIRVKTPDGGTQLYSIGGGGEEKTFTAYGMKNNESTGYFDVVYSNMGSVSSSKGLQFFSFMKSQVDFTLYTIIAFVEDDGQEHPAGSQFDLFNGVWIS